MADPTTNPVGASSSNPISPTLGGSEVGANPPAVDDSVSGAVGRFILAVMPYIAALNSDLQETAPADAAHHVKVGANRQRVIPMVSTMLRTEPTLSGVTADGLDAVMSDVAACNGLTHTLQGVVNALVSTGRLRLEYGWQVSSGAIATARKLAPRNAPVATEVDAHPGPRVEDDAGGPRRGRGAGKGHQGQRTGHQGHGEVRGGNGQGKRPSARDG